MYICGYIHIDRVVDIDVDYIDKDDYLLSVFSVKKHVLHNVTF